MSNSAKNKEAIEILKRFNYNKGNIDIETKDYTYRQIADMNISEQTKKSAIEFKTVIQALSLVSQDSRIIFEQFYILNKNKLDIMNEYGMSARTFERRKEELTSAIQKEIIEIKSNL